jgi:Ca2+-binding EF-hand superfamily protein
VCVSLLSKFLISILLKFPFCSYVLTTLSCISLPLPSKGVNLGIGEEKCREIATNVAYNLANSSDDKRRSSVSANEFHAFWTEFVDSPKGQQEFFHRTVFAAFDVDGNGYLDPNELDKLLETFYEAGSIFKGDHRLPDKESLRKIVNDRLDKDKDGKLSFEEIRMLISGSADLA